MDKDLAIEMVALREDIDALWLALNLTEERLIEAQQRDDTARLVETIKRQVSEQAKETHEHSQRYSTTIISAGYASYFAVWGLSKDYLTPVDVRIAGLSGLISVSVFVVWTVSSMIYASITFKWVKDIIDDRLTFDEFFVRHDQFRDRVTRGFSVLWGLWPWVLAVAILTILPGWVAMLRRFVISLWGEAE